MNQLINTELSTREHVYTQLKSQILRGELRKGTKLREIPLSQRLGVSRTPVREAVQQLAKDGLVSIEAFKGAWVSCLDASEIDAIYNVRECLDGLTLTGSHRHDVAQADTLLEGWETEPILGVLGDKGYDSEAIIAMIKAMKAEAVIPLRQIGLCNESMTKISTKNVIW